MVKPIQYYFENGARKETDPKKKAEFQRELTNYNRSGRYTSNDDYAAKKSFMPKLSRRALSDRYEDLFDDLMKYTEKDVETKDDLKTELKRMMRDRKTGSMSFSGIDRLYDSLLETSKGSKLEVRIEKITPENRAKYEGFAKNKEKYATTDKTLYRLLKNKKVTLFYETINNYKKGAKQKKRDFNTGRYV